MKKNLKILNNIKIAHRGLWNDKFPENSVGAFLNCIEKKVPIELDVHLTKDNILVVFHDNNLKRMTGENLLLKNCCYDEIKNLKLKNTNYTIPTLEEVLRLVQGKVLLDIEIKNDRNDWVVCENLCRLLDTYSGDFIIKSFNPFYIWWFKKYRPNFIRGLLISRLSKTKMNKILKLAFFKMWFNFLAKPDFIVFDQRDLPNKRVEKLRKKGMPVLLFTINKKDIENYNQYTGVLYEER